MEIKAMVEKYEENGGGRIRPARRQHPMAQVDAIGAVQLVKS